MTPEERYRILAWFSSQHQGGVSGVDAYNNMMVFRGNTFDFINNRWLDKSGRANHVSIKNASARTGDGDNLDYIITGLLTTDTVEVESGSDSPTIPVNGTLRIADGDVVYGVTIKRAAATWSVIPFCEPTIEGNLPTTSYDVSGNSRNAVCATLAAGNVTTQDNYFYLQKYGYNDTKIKYDSDFSGGVDGVSIAWGTAGDGTFTAGDDVLNIDVTSQPSSSATVRPYLEKSNLLTSGIKSKITISGTGLYAGYNIGAGLVSFSPTNHNLVNDESVVVGTPTATTGYLYFNGQDKTTFTVSKIKNEEYYIVPGVLTGTNDAQGETLRYTQDGSTWLRYACDISLPVAINKPELSTIIISGYCVNGVDYFIENTEVDHFGEGVAKYSTFTSDGTESLSESNSVRKVLSDNFFSDGSSSVDVSFSDMKSWRAHLYYCQMEADAYDGGGNYNSPGYMDDLVIFKDSYYLTNSDHLVFTDHYTLNNEIDFPLVVFSWDHATNAEAESLASSFDSKSVLQTFFVNFSHKLSNTQILALTTDNEVGLHTVSVNGVYPDERKGTFETEANYTAEELDTYYQYAYNYYLSEIGYQIKTNAFPSGEFTPDLSDVECLKTFNIGRRTSATYTVNNRLRIPVDNWGGLYSQSIDTINYNALVTQVDAIISNGRQFLSIYGHPSDWSGTYDADGNVDGGGDTHREWVEALLDYVRTNQNAGDEIRVVTFKQLYNIITQVEF